MTGIIYDIRDDENYVIIKDNEKVVEYLFNNFRSKSSIILVYLLEVNSILKQTLHEIVPLEILSGKELNKTEPLAFGEWNDTRDYLRAYCIAYRENRFFRLDMVKGILMHKREAIELYGDDFTKYIH
jgi:hypothetical protein